MNLNIIKDKLITHEDNFHLHKTLGILCLLNFGYQFYLYFMYNKTLLNIFTLLPHILLHISSLRFKVLEKHPGDLHMSMISWKELRLHSLIFAYRACLCILFIDYAYIFTILTMVCADIATYYYGTLGVSNVRGRHEKFGNSGFIKELSTIFFSTSQMSATIITFGLIQNKPSEILIFSTLMPTQTYMFGLNIIQKNIISKKTWKIIYSLGLLFTYFIWYKEYNNLYIVSLSIFIYLLRCIGISKYIIWYYVLFCNNLLYIKLS